MRKHITALAPCKINLSLAISQRRPDGFHGIESVFLALDLQDTLRIEISAFEEDSESTARAASADERDRLLMNTSALPATLARPLAALPPERNLVLRAASLFRRRGGFRGLEDAAVHADLYKRIPAGAGLGGGSSDAAATLLALNTLTGSPFSLPELTDMGAELGSDIPFFLCAPRAALVEGCGEKITRIASPDLALVLLHPGFSSDTAASYAQLDASRSTPSPAASEAAREDWLLRNDFLQVFLENAPHAGDYRAMLNTLRKAGAHLAGLSGSGSACFGIFRDDFCARKAHNDIEAAGIWPFARLAHTLAQA